MVVILVGVSSGAPNKRDQATGLMIFQWREKTPTGNPMVFWSSQAFFLVTYQHHSEIVGNSIKNQVSSPKNKIADFQTWCTHGDEGFPRDQCNIEIIIKHPRLQILENSAGLNLKYRQDFQAVTKVRFSNTVSKPQRDVRNFLQMGLVLSNFFKPNDSPAAVAVDCARGKRHSRKHTKKNILPHCLPFKSGRKMPGKTQKKAASTFQIEFAATWSCNITLQLQGGMSQNWRFFPAKKITEIRTANFETQPHCQSPQSHMLDGEKKLGQAACWFTFFVASFYDTSISYHLGPEEPPKRKKKKHKGK